MQDKSFSQILADGASELKKNSISMLVMGLVFTLIDVYLPSNTGSGIFAAVLIVLIWQNAKVRELGVKKLDKDYLKQINFTGRWIKLFVNDLLVGFLLIFCFLLFIIPGIFFGVKWLFVPIISFDKNVWINEALSYSGKLVKGRWLKIFFLLILTLLLPLVIIFFIGGLIINSGLDQLISVVVMSLLINVLFIYYNHVYFTYYKYLDSLYSSTPLPQSTASPIVQS